MTRQVFLAVLLTSLVGCTGGAVLKRPKNVPGTAVWSGGPDGGDWFDCAVGESTMFNNCTVYADVTGAVVESGRYQLKGSNRAATKDELQYAYHSKGEIFLKNNKALIRLGP